MFNSVCNLCLCVYWRSRCHSSCWMVLVKFSGMFLSLIGWEKWYFTAVQRSVIPAETGERGGQWDNPLVWRRTWQRRELTLGVCATCSWCQVLAICCGSGTGYFWPQSCWIQWNDMKHNAKPCYLGSWFCEVSSRFSLFTTPKITVSESESYTHSRVRVSESES